MRTGKTTYIDLVVDTEPLEAGAVAIKGLELAIQGLVSQLGDAFQKVDVSPVTAQTVNLARQIKKCDGQLLYLRLSLGRLRTAVADAAAPFGSVLLPVINEAVNDLAKLADHVGLVCGALVEALWGTDAAADSADKASDAYAGLTAAAGKARRTLADFDQIQRLGSASGGSASQLPDLKPEVLSPQLQAVTEKLLQLLEPLRNIDTKPLITALQELGACMEKVWQQIGGALEWVWQELLTPLVTWIIEELAPALTDTFGGALELLSAALTPVGEGLGILWEALEPVVAYIGETVITVLGDWQQVFEDLAEVFRQRSPEIREIFENIAQVITAVWQLVQPVLEDMTEGFRDTFGDIGQVVSRVVSGMIGILYSLSEILSSVISGDWEGAWEGMRTFLKQTVNGMIGILNGMLAGITSAFNGVIRSINSVSFQMPSWVPGMGGVWFGLNLPTVRAPQIPYLAQGAVLPANRPFLAVVGDQRHGTNVEAPLTTIQEAVAQVTADQNRAMLAAMAASVDVQREILQAVLGIHIGDDMLARAVDRYNRKMAVVYGSPY